VERGDKNHRAEMDHVFWNDAELMIDSVDAVAGSAARFDLTWQAAGGAASEGLARLKASSSSAASSSSSAAGGERIRVVHHEPVAMRGADGDDHYLNTVLATLEGAGAGDKIAIENPYFMPLPAMRDAMVQAAKRGAKITIVTNGLTDNNDGQMVARLSRRFSMRELVETKGIEVYETLGTADPVHRKTLVAVDKRGRDVWLVGSHNLDPLSARINREMFVVGGAGLDPAAKKTSTTGQALLDDAIWDTLARASRRVTADELKPGPVDGVVSDYLLSLLTPVL
jgi:phosphatidylserine/phosphatidylglycerophosphate/cardiolipin synthase-like enzyme